MNKKGQMAAVGGFLTLFIGIIVALTLINGGISSNIGTVTNTVNVVNQTNTLSATTLLSGQAVSDVIVTNASSGAVVPATNYTIVNYDVSTGSLRTYLASTGGSYVGKSINVSYTYEPLGYATNAGSRAVTSMILVFACLGVISFVVWRIYEDGFFGMFK